ncbi:MAG TPA: hypothetical protein VI141_06415, partial [Acidimicrobiia bacterium]
DAHRVSAVPGGYGIAVVDGSGAVVVVASVVVVVASVVVVIGSDVVVVGAVDVVVGGNVVGGRGEEVVVVGRCVVGVVPGPEVVGVVGFDGVDVVVVVGGGSVARVKPEVVVVAKGPPNVVVVASPPADPGTVVPKKPGNAAPPSSPPSPPVGAIAPTSPEDAEDLPWNQLMPMVTANARPPARARSTRPDMSRPTMTLLRSEKERPCFSGPTVARCSAICLARSSGLNLSRPFGPRPLGGGTGYPFSP